MDTLSTLETIEGQRTWEKADTRQRLELARRLEATIKKIDAIKAELNELVYDVERGP
jgi:hypothetical protein